MIHAVKRLWVLCALAVLATGALARTSTDSKGLSPKGSTINDRAELMRYVADESESNPIAKLSAAARQRLLANTLYGPSGQIQSLYFVEIVEELRPADAYEVFSMFGFGFPCSSVIAAHGASSTGRDRDILEKVCKMPSEKNGMSCAYEGYMCNGGYYQANRQFLCSPSSCQPR